MSGGVEGCGEGAGLGVRGRNPQHTCSGEELGSGANDSGLDQALNSGSEGCCSFFKNNKIKQESVWHSVIEKWDVNPLVWPELILGTL